MAITFTRQVVTTGTGTTSIINSNFEAIQNALSDAVSRAGTSANAMNANLDMNSKRIINLPAATTNTEPVNYGQFLAAQGDLLYSGEIDASAVVFTPTGTDAVERTVYDDLVLRERMPEQFGAIGDGITDDTAAVQACINACIASGVTHMYCPQIYKITSTLQITVPDPGSFVLRGAAAYYSRFIYSGTGYCIQVGTSAGSNACDGWRVTIRDMGIYAASSTPTGGIKFGGTRYCAVENCIIREFTNASGRCIFLAGTGDIPNYYVRIVGNQFRNAPTGIYLDGGSGIGANSNYIRNNWFGVHSSYAINIDGGDTNIIEANEFNGSITTAIFLQNDANYNKILFNQFDGPTYSVNVSSSACDDTWIYGNTGGTVLDSGTGTYSGDPITGTLYSRKGLIIGGPFMPTNIVPLRVKAPVGLSTDAFQIQNSAGTSLFSVNQGGAVTGVTLTTTGSISQTNTNGNSIMHSIDATGTPAAVISKMKQASGQTANVLEVQNTSGTVEFRIGPKGFLEFLEQTDPTAPSSNRAILYSKDNGAGKTQLCVRFPTGAVQVLATEP